MDNLTEYAWLQQLFGTQDLYAIPSHSPEKEPEAPPQEQLPALAYHGTFGNSILVVYSHPDSQAFMQGSSYALLTKILAAVKCDIQSIALLNLQDNSSIKSASQLIEALEPTKALFFLVEQEQKQLGLGHARYHITQQGGTPTVLSDPLSDLSGNNELKRQLWVSLQKLFQ